MTTKNWSIHTTLDVFRALAYTVALCLFFLVGDKIVLSSANIFKIFILFSFVALDGYLRYNLRDNYLRDKLSESGGVRLILVLLFFAEIAGLFFICGWGGYFVSQGGWLSGGNHVNNPDAYSNLASFCICAFIHNALFLPVLVYCADRQAGRWHAVWASVPSYFVTAVLSDAREAPLLMGAAGLWLQKLNGLGDAIQRKMESKAIQIRTSDRPFLSLAANTMVALLGGLFHLVAQFAALHLLAFNLLFAIILWLVSRDLPRDTAGFAVSKHWNSPLSILSLSWLIVLLISLFFYCITSGCEEYRRRTARNHAETNPGQEHISMGRGFVEKGSQFLGNLLLVVGLLCIIQKSSWAASTWIALGTQSIIILLMAIGTLYSTIPEQGAQEADGKSATEDVR